MKGLRHGHAPIEIMANVVIAAGGSETSEIMDARECNGDYALQVSLSGDASAVGSIYFEQSLDKETFPKQVNVVTAWTPTSGSAGKTIVNLTDVGSPYCRLTAVETGGVDAATVNVQIVPTGKGRVMY